MATNRPAGNRVETIHCDNCDEEYAATYKRCPFCNGRPVSENGDKEARGRSSRRSEDNTRGGGYGGPTPFHIIGTVISLAIIVAAVVIVVSIIMPLVKKGETTLVSPAPNPQHSMQPSPGGSSDPNATQDPAVIVPPVATPTVSAGHIATNFKLSSGDFTLLKYGEVATIKATFTPAGSGTVTFTSDKPEVASVDRTTGKVKGISRGRATITAVASDGGYQICIVRCGFDAPAGAGATPSTPPQPSAAVKPSSTPKPSVTPPSSTTLTLNRTDFTLIKKNETFKMKVSGTSSAAVWSIGDTAVATISADGTITSVSKGSTTVTCKVDGKTLTCIVRCNF